MRTCACRQLVAAAQSLLELAGAAERCLAQPSSVPAWLLAHTSAGCIALGGCAIAAQHMGHLSVQGAFKIGAAISLVFGPGRVQLEAALDAAQASSTPQELAAIPQLCGVMLTVVDAIMAALLSPDRHPEAAAAFASSTARPPLMLPWLAAVSRALPVAMSSNPGDPNASTCCLHE